VSKQPGAETERGQVGQQRLSLLNKPCILTPQHEFSQERFAALLDDRQRREDAFDAHKAESTTKIQVQISTLGCKLGLRSPCPFPSRSTAGSSRGCVSSKLYFLVALGLSPPLSVPRLCCSLQDLHAKLEQKGAILDKTTRGEAAAESSTGNEQAAAL
jgi:hypothetical protein